MQPIRLLIVDDEVDLVSILRERLVLRGFEVEATTSGADALRRAAEDDFDALVLDVKMPGIDGLELLDQIKGKRPGLPVILFTGHSSVVDAERGMQAGAFDYLVKPIDLDALVEKIHTAVGLKKGNP